MDDTTRGVGPRDEFSGRGDETTRNYASPSRRPDTPPPADRPVETGRAARAEPADLDPESERRTREIQGEIASTRAEMSETIDALQEKLRPGNIVSGATERMKSATTERMRNMADTASGTAQQMIQGARQNPIPAMMISAGIAWMLIDRRRQHGDGPMYREWSGGVTRRSVAGESAEYDRETSGMTHATRGIGDRARQTTRRAQHAFQRMIHQNPLLVGAAAVLAGAAIGATIPESEKERELMGEARDRVVDRAQDVAQRATGAVKDVAQNVVGDTVSKVAERVTSPKER